MKKLLSILVILSLLVTFAVGCSNSSSEKGSQDAAKKDEQSAQKAEQPAQKDTKSDAKKGPINVAVIIKATDSDFWQYLLIGAENAAKENPDKVKVTTYGPPSEADIDKQVAILENVIAQKPDAIVIASTSSDATVPALEKAYEQGIKIITVDNKVKTDKVHSFLATDNKKGGALAAEQLVASLKAKNIPLKGKVGLISAMAGVQVLVDRDTGFIEKMKEIAPEIQILETRYTDNDMVKALAAAEDIITANNDIIGFFADNNMTGNGVARAIKERKLEDKVAVVAFDSDPEEVDSLRSGAIKALVVQDPYGMGYKGTMFAYQAVMGEQIPKVVDTGATVVTKDNMDKEDIKGLLDPTLKKK
jgi:ribose transport system substrate-binding protein